MGISPTAARALMPHGADHVRRHDLSALRLIGSTGEPWNPEPFRWVFETVGQGRVPIINYSGGTEISGGLVASFPILPIKPCSFAGPIPGIAADVFDENGKPVRGQVGELVVTRPWPGMTQGFWRDPARYDETYWSRWPGVWVHGDWAYVDDEGFWFLQGRSDDTLKIAGKRLGPAEVESVLVAHPAVGEAAAIGVPHDVKGEAIVCFVVLKPGGTPSEPLRDELTDHVARQMGKALRPSRVLFAGDLPKTRSAKIMRRVIRATYLGREPGDLSSLENPAASLVFPWFPMQRQVIVAGGVEKVSRAETEAYFATRPRGSQLGAWASPQSQVLPDRAAVDAGLAAALEQFGADGPVPAPPHWGGLRVVPETVEFWQGRSNRLHDRLRYRRRPDGAWIVERLAP